MTTDDEKSINIERDLTTVSAPENTATQHTKRNLSNLDRSIRALGGIACIVLGIVKSSLLGGTLPSVFVVGFGVLNLGSAIACYCPVYGIATFSTFKRPPTSPDKI
jgi:hypothetical protein